MAQKDRSLHLLLLLISFSTLSMAAYDIVAFGARPDARTDAAKPLLRAWAKACSSTKPSIIYIPQGSFFVSEALFLGPCRNSAIRILINGTIVASSGYDRSLKWLHFKNVQGLGIIGGFLEGRGKSLWDCKEAGRSCPVGSISLTISNSKSIVISGLTSLNSKQVHISIQNSNGVTVRNTKIIAPKDSPNTDGMHIQTSNAVTITNSIIKTGDDCISIKDGVRDVSIDRINCGPGHGISIGSLAETANEAGVQNITVKSVVLTGTQNGLRIKTWGRPSTGFVKGVTFQHAIMNNVQNPIIIDQNYCPNKKKCPNQDFGFFGVLIDEQKRRISNCLRDTNGHSGIKISGVSFTNIQGSSATKVAMKFDCSRNNPCTGMQLRNINLTYGKTRAQSFCRNARGRASGTVIPPSCLQ